MRITKNDLEHIVSVLNNKCGFESKPKWNDIGSYHISGAYGGVTLHKIVNESGGVQTVLPCGYTTKKELYNLVCAYLQGIGTTQTT